MCATNMRTFLSAVAVAAVSVLPALGDDYNDEPTAA